VIGYADIRVAATPTRTVRVRGRMARGRIELTTHRLDARVILDAADRAQVLFEGGPAEFDES
jgi:hypothetical protein